MPNYQKTRLHLLPRAAAFVAAVMFLAAVAGCMGAPAPTDTAIHRSATPAANTSASATAAAQPRIVELFPGGNHTSPISAVVAPSRPDGSGKPLEARPGEMLLPRAADPAKFPPLPVAEAGIVGLYLPTLDYTRAEDYGLMIYPRAAAPAPNGNSGGNGNGSSSDPGPSVYCWMLLRNRQEPDMMGFGTLQERSGGYEFVELERTGSNGTREVAVQQFPVESRRNCWTIGLPAQSPVGGDRPTALGKLMQQFGSKVHWVRASVAGENDERLATAPVVGSFSPLTMRLPDSRPGYTVDPRCYLAIWPDGQWRMVEDLDGERRVTGGTFVVGDQGREGAHENGENRENRSAARTLTFTWSEPAPPAGDPPTATFSFVYDAGNHVLWLTRQAGSEGIPHLLPAEPGDEHTVVYVLRVERAER